jgi:hypothetical protein
MVNGAGHIRRPDQSNNLVTIADFPAEADRYSILMVNGSLKADPVELRRFGGWRLASASGPQILVQVLVKVSRSLPEVLA